MEIALDLTKRYTYADYLTWVDDIRREIIDGVVSLMAGPNIKHSRVSKNLYSRLDSIISSSEGSCEVFYAPVDVCLPQNGETENDKIYTVVQPDMFIVCDHSKLEDGRCLGAPDMIIEILSPSNRKRDIVTKFILYQSAGVGEYWIADPKTKSITAHILQPNGEYDDGEVYTSGEKAAVHIFGGVTVDVDEIFNY